MDPSTPKSTKVTADSQKIVIVGEASGALPFQGPTATFENTVVQSATSDVRKPLVWKSEPRPNLVSSPAVKKDAKKNPSAGPPKPKNLVLSVPKGKEKPAVTSPSVENVKVVAVKPPSPQLKLTKVAAASPLKSYANQLPVTDEKQKSPGPLKSPPAVPPKPKMKKVAEKEPKEKGRSPLVARQLEQSNASKSPVSSAKKDVPPPLPNTAPPSLPPSAMAFLKGDLPDTELEQEQPLPNIGLYEQVCHCGPSLFSSEDSVTSKDLQAVNAPVKSGTEGQGSKAHVEGGKSEVAVASTGQGKNETAVSEAKSEQEPGMVAVPGNMPCSMKKDGEECIEECSTIYVEVVATRPSSAKKDIYDKSKSTLAPMPSLLKDSNVAISGLNTSVGVTSSKQIPKELVLPDEVPQLEKNSVTTGERPPKPFTEVGEIGKSKASADIDVTLPAKKHVPERSVDTSKVQDQAEASVEPKPTQDYIVGTVEKESDIEHGIIVKDKNRNLEGALQERQLTEVEKEFELKKSNQQADEPNIEERPSFEIESGSNQNTDSKSYASVSESLIGQGSPDIQELDTSKEETGKKAAVGISAEGRDSLLDDTTLTITDKQDLKEIQKVQPTPVNADIPTSKKEEVEKLEQVASSMNDEMPVSVPTTVSEQAPEKTRDLQLEVVDTVEAGLSSQQTSVEDVRGAVVTEEQNLKTSLKEQKVELLEEKVENSIATNIQAIDKPSDVHAEEQCDINSVVEMKASVTAEQPASKTNISFKSEESCEKPEMKQDIAKEQKGEIHNMTDKAQIEDNAKNTEEHVLQETLNNEAILTNEPAQLKLGAEVTDQSAHDKQEQDVVGSETKFETNLFEAGDVKQDTATESTLKQTSFEEISQDQQKLEEHGETAMKADAVAKEDKQKKIDNQNQAEASQKILKEENEVVAAHKDNVKNATETQPEKSENLVDVSKMASEKCAKESGLEITGEPAATTAETGLGENLQISAPKREHAEHKSRPKATGVPVCMPVEDLARDDIKEDTKDSTLPGILFHFACLVCSMAPLVT